MGEVLVVGGGAAGYFAAITAANAGDHRVVLAEAGAKPLRKVEISGGGRCNVTHRCFEPADLIRGYPRGARELRGPFSRFQPRDTVHWFESAGVKLKTEPDGRMFPTTDSSQTIIDCLESKRKESGVSLAVRTKVSELTRTPGGRIAAVLQEGKVGGTAEFDAVVIASGSSPGGYDLARKLGHTIIPCVPSLFSFKITDDRLSGLAGISVDNAALSLTVEGAKPFQDRGPLLITHWGLSGPGVIRLSAWAARPLAEQSYQATLDVNWLGELPAKRVLETLQTEKALHAKRSVAANPLFSSPKRLWTSFCSAAGIAEEDRWGSLRGEQLAELQNQLTSGKYAVTGKGEFKEEFVTCGGVDLTEVDFRRMESKLVPGLYFAGEVLDIDGITGGFNFQSAWTTGWIAGSAIAERLS